MLMGIQVTQATLLGEEMTYSSLVACVPYDIVGIDYCLNTKDQTGKTRA